MTIAACYVSSEGVVLGADSTSTLTVAGRGPKPPGTQRHFNFGQKIFEVGQQSTLALVTWGMGNLLTVSYRTLSAQFADALSTQPAQSMQEVADRWN